MKKLSVHLVTWNGEKYIPYLFESLRNQTFKDWELVVLDNASTDGTFATIKEIIVQLDNLSIRYRIIENAENIGFAGGHNRLFRETDSEYVLLLNQDMYLEPDCLENTVTFLDENKDVAAVSPRLMKWNFEKLQHSTFNIQHSFSDQIDTLGLKVFRNRRVVEKYTGKSWNEKKTKMQMSYRTSGGAMEVFGVSGALPMFRVSSMREVVFEDRSLFDESYHSYKEDVDIAFRLRSRGFKSFVLLYTVAYHDRSAAGPKEEGDRNAFKNKKDQSEWVKYHSYKNHLMTLYKNEYWQNTALDFFSIAWYELKKFVYFLLFDRKVLKGLGEIWNNRKQLKKKRIRIKNNRKVNYKEIREWWN